VFFHNGVFHRLEDAVRFYAERDSKPQKWYSRANQGSTLKFDDLPARYIANMDFQAPFGGDAGGTAAFSDADIRDIVAFLRTLTDGYRAPYGMIAR
jgi:cytochrome c peroxidase